MRIGADGGKSEFHHVGLGDDHGAGAAQPRDDRGVGRRGLFFIGQDFRAGARDFAGNIEQILDGDDLAVEGPERNPVARPPVGGIGRGHRALLIKREAGAGAFAVRIGNIRERLFQTRA